MTREAPDPEKTVTGVLELIPVGAIHSSIRKKEDMPLQGVPGTVEIYPDYWKALDGIESNSHLILLCWMHRGGRDLLVARARKISPDLPEKGVFALRSPSRPNPISLSVVRLVKKREGGFLEVDLLDLIDGTPVIDIKPYQPGWDAVFSATTHDRSGKILKMGAARYRESLIREAVNYHGEWCSGTAMAVRIGEKITEILGGDLRRTGISLDPGINPCLADALIGITGARPGNRRLTFRRPRSASRKADEIRFISPGSTCTVSLKPLKLSKEMILTADEEDLFSIRLKSRQNPG